MPTVTNECHVDEHIRTEKYLVYIVRCPLTTISEKACRLSSLRSLTFHACGNLTALPPAVCLLKQLSDLVLFNCPRLTVIPCDIGDLTSLGVLRIRSCPIKVLPHTIGNLRSLKTLILDDMPIDTLPASIGNLFQLSHVQLHDLPRFDFLPDSFGTLPSLELCNIRNLELDAIGGWYTRLSTKTQLVMSPKWKTYVPHGYPVPSMQLMVGYSIRLLIMIASNRGKRRRLPRIPREIWAIIFHEFI